MKLKLILFSVLTVVVLSEVKGQYFGGQTSYWKNRRHSLGFSVGAANFLGELGGRDRVGTDFVYDLEFSETRPALQALYRYQLSSRFFAKAQFGFAYVGGNDALTEEIFRRNRNLHFRSSLFEFSIQGEFNVLDWSPRNRYNLKVSRNKIEGTQVYVTAGVGLVRFNPKANFAGNWYPLDELNTEGQGLTNGPEDYDLFTVVLPLGLGIRWEVNPEWTLGIEVCHRTTFTDYMDDVSTVYYDNTKIKENYGELAAYFADPSLGYFVDENGNEIPLNSTFTGAQRGDSSDNDAYMFGTINVYYKLTKKRFKRGRGRITKRRQRRVVF